MLCTGVKISSSWLGHCYMMMESVKHLVNRKFFPSPWFLYDTAFWRQVMFSYTTLPGKEAFFFFFFPPPFLQSAEEKYCHSEINIFFWQRYTLEITYLNLQWFSFRERAPQGKSEFSIFPRPSGSWRKWSQYTSICGHNQEGSFDTNAVVDLFPT